MINQDSKPTKEKGSTAVTVKPLCSNMEKPNMNMPILTRNEGLVKVSQRNESKEVTTTSLKVADLERQIQLLLFSEDVA